MQRKDINFVGNYSTQNTFKYFKKFKEFCLEKSLGENLDLRQIQKTGCKVFGASAQLRIDSSYINIKNA